MREGSRRTGDGDGDEDDDGDGDGNKNNTTNKNHRHHPSCPPVCGFLRSELHLVYTIHVSHHVRGNQAATNFK